MNRLPFEITSNMQSPKYEQIKQGIVEAIRDGRLRVGDSLPSLHTVRRELGVSLNTVIRAYRELKERGVIESTSGKGFFISSVLLEPRRNVFLMLDSFTFFKENLYTFFRNALGDRSVIDVYFHHHNLEVFESLVTSRAGRHHYYIIIPPPNPQAVEVISQLPRERVLILDQFYRDYQDYSYICQDFRNDVYKALIDQCEVLRKYKTLISIPYTRPSQRYLEAYTREVNRGLRRLCVKAGLPFKISQSIRAKSIERGALYFIHTDEDLIEFIRNCQEHSIRIGEDLGVISYNDSQFKEILEGGISVVSTDFHAMGTAAAEFVLTGEFVQKINPFNFIQRHSIL